MNLEYTFKDGVTLPIRVIIRTYESTNINGNSTEMRSYTEAYASNLEMSVYDDGYAEVGRSNVEAIPELLSAVFRKLQEITSSEFIENPLVGIKRINPIGCH